VTDKQVSAIDAFCGAGGLSLGLRRAGFSVRLAFDLDSRAVETYRQNLGDHGMVLDATEVSADELLRLAGLAPGELDLLAGGPPCQGFSMQRRGGSEDPRNRLVLRFIELIEQLLPSTFLLENVPAIRSVRGSHFIEALTSRAHMAGYTCHVHTLDAADFGVAQHRKRAFVVGIRTGVAFAWPQVTSPHRVSVREALRGLPSPPEDGSPHDSVPNHYREGRLSKLNIERIKHVPPGGGRENLPPSLQLRCHQNGHRHLDTYGRLDWDKPSGTITARFDSFTRGRFGHPEEHRSITLREGARLQGFPDSFVFTGTREEGARMIGNAVPPPLAEALGRQILQCLADESQEAATA
jgi:DNA (cytosine-5)-methyltransferase 1